MFRILLLLLIVAATASAEPDKYQIGIILPYTGVYQEYAKECEEGFTLARSEASPLLKEQVQFLTEDDLSTPKSAVNAFQKLLQNKNLVAVSLFSSSNVLAATSLSVANKVTLLGLSAIQNS